MKVLIRNFSGRSYECITIVGLAALTKRQPITIRKWIENGVIPEANIRDASIKTSSGQVIKGQRLYVKSFALRVAEIITTEIKQGVPISDEVKHRIAVVFKEERTELTRK